MYLSWREWEFLGVECLLGKTLKSVTQQNITQHGQDSITFTTEDGVDYFMLHDQECCEEVYIEDINGDLEDLVGTPILLAEEVSEEGNTDWGTYTWTFYKIGTIKGTVTIRWNGESNGYYSEEVSFVTKKRKE